MSADIHQFDSTTIEKKACNCSESIQETMNGMSNEATLDGGCENSAILHHGSYIRIGCLQFAFTIVDFMENEKAHDKTSVKKEVNEIIQDIEPTEEEIKEEVVDETDVGQVETSKEATEFEDSRQASDSMDIDP